VGKPVLRTELGAVIAWYARTFVIDASPVPGAPDPGSASAAASDTDWRAAADACVHGWVAKVADIA
jgi:hypothetical protein